MTIKLLVAIQGSGGVEIPAGTEVTLTDAVEAAHVSANKAVYTRTPESFDAPPSSGIGVKYDPVTGMVKFDESNITSFKSTGYDQTAVIQQAIDDTYVSLGGTSGQDTKYNTSFTIELIDGQEYAISGLKLPPGCSIVSESRAPVPFSDKTGVASGALPVSTGPVVRHIGTDKPLFQNDTSKGIIRTGSQKYNLNTIMGITMTCDRFSATRRGDADLIRWVSSFGLNLIGNLAFTSSGFGLRIISCNTVNLLYNNFLFAPWMLYNIVDSNIGFNQVGGGNGFASDSVWITGDGDASQWSRLCLFQNNLFYNNNSNGNVISQYAPSVTVTAISGDTLTLDTDVGKLPTLGQNWLGETPVVISTSGTLPTATGHTISETKTYWVTVLPSGNQVKLSKNRADRAAGVYLNFTEAGSGNALRVGGNANIHLNAGAQSNQFQVTRPDQSFGDAILCNGSVDNTFSNLLIAYSRAGNAGGTGYVVPSPGPAVTLKNGATGNRFDGTIDGVRHPDVGVGPSNQKFAFDIDASSERGTDTSGVYCPNHTAANSETGAQAYKQSKLNPRRISLSPADFTQVVATATLGISLGARQTLSMAANGSTAAASVMIPNNWTSIKARILWANNSTSSGTVTWSARIGNYAVGDAANATEQTLVAASNDVVPTGGDQYILKETAIDLGSSSGYAGDVAAFRIIRSDASGPALQVLQVILEDGF